MRSEGKEKPKGKTGGHGVTCKPKKYHSWNFGFSPFLNFRNWYSQQEQKAL